MTNYAFAIGRAPPARTGRAPCTFSANWSVSDPEAGVTNYTFAIVGKDAYSEMMDDEEEMMADGRELGWATGLSLAATNLTVHRMVQSAGWAFDFETAAQALQAVEMLIRLAMTRVGEQGVRLMLPLLPPPTTPPLSWLILSRCLLPHSSLSLYQMPKPWAVQRNTTTGHVALYRGAARQPARQDARAATPSVTTMVATRAPAIAAPIHANPCLALAAAPETTLKYLQPLDKMRKYLPAPDALLGLPSPCDCILRTATELAKSQRADAERAHAHARGHAQAQARARARAQAQVEALEETLFDRVVEADTMQREVRRLRQALATVSMPPGLALEPIRHLHQPWAHDSSLCHPYSTAVP